MPSDFAEPSGVELGDLTAHSPLMATIGSVFAAWRAELNEAMALVSEASGTRVA